MIENLLVFGIIGIVIAAIVYFIALYIKQKRAEAKRREQEELEADRAAKKARDLNLKKLHSSSTPSKGVYVPKKQAVESSAYNRFNSSADNTPASQSSGITSGNVLTTVLLYEALSHSHNSDKPESRSYSDSSSSSSSSDSSSSSWDSSSSSSYDSGSSSSSYDSGSSSSSYDSGSSSFSSF